jgi:hypothetical protein
MRPRSKDDIVLLSSEYPVVKILKPTKAQFFQDIEEGDILRFSMVMKGAGRSSRGLYASYITVENLTQATDTANSLNDLDNRLKNFELGEMQ